MNDCKYVHGSLIVHPTGYIGSCCYSDQRSSGKIHIDDVDDLHEYFMNSEWMSELRSTPWRDHPHCAGCLEKEQQGLSTGFDNAENRLPNLDISKGPQLTNLEITASNLCNQQCFACNSQFSTKWIKDDMALADHPDGKFNHRGKGSLGHIQQLSDGAIAKIKKLFPYIKSIELKGGEPIIDVNNISILEEIAEKWKDIQVTVCTNMQVMNDRAFNALTALIKENRITICCSVDGVGDVFNYTRGGNWEKLIENMDRLGAVGASLSVQPMLTIANIYDAPNIVEFFAGKEYVNDITLMGHNIITDPRSSSILSVDESIMRPALEAYKQAVMSTRFNDRWQIGEVSFFPQRHADVAEWIRIMNGIHGVDLYELEPRLKFLQEA